jgi:RNA polymerase sigma-70 factor (ECF subfamily)
VDLEERFALQLQAFDHQAWSDLFDEHRDKIWRYLLARTGSADTADDLTAQVFVEALESIERYQYLGKPILAWLYRIARNQTGKALRTASRRAPITSEPRAEHPLDERLDALVLADALRCLTTDQADVISLRFLSGYSTGEIAQATGKSASAVYSLEVRALTRLRRYFGVDERSSADEIWAAQGIDR